VLGATHDFQFAGEPAGSSSSHTVGLTVTVGADAELGGGALLLDDADADDGPALDTGADVSLGCAGACGQPATSAQRTTTLRISAHSDLNTSQRIQCLDDASTRKARLDEPQRRASLAILSAMLGPTRR